MNNEVTLGEIIMFLGALIFFGLNLFMYLENGFRIKPKEGEILLSRQIAFRLIVIALDLILLCVLGGALVGVIINNWDLVVLP